MVAVALSPVRRAGYFCVWMAAPVAFIAFGAFAPTYWLQLPAGTLSGLAAPSPAWRTVLLLGPISGIADGARRQSGNSTITAPGA
jgi:hypothetical protein